MQLPRGQHHNHHQHHAYNNQPPKPWAAAAAYAAMIVIGRNGAGGHATCSDISTTFISTLSSCTCAYKYNIPVIIYLRAIALSVANTGFIKMLLGPQQHCFNVYFMYSTYLYTYMYLLNSILCIRCV